MIKLTKKYHIILDVFDNESYYCLIHTGCTEAKDYDGYPIPLCYTGQYDPNDVYEPFCYNQTSTCGHTYPSKSTKQKFEFICKSLV